MVAVVAMIVVVDVVIVAGGGGGLAALIDKVVYVVAVAVDYNARQGEDTSRLNRFLNSEPVFRNTLPNRELSLGPIPMRKLQATK